MKFKSLLLFLALIAGTSGLNSQNYLRAMSPDNWWGAPLTNEPGWQDYFPHGIFTDLSLVVSPQGIYTEIEVFATITHDPDEWTSEFEIVWQFDLPAKTIVHDSWLWVEDEIIRADVVDFWTALNTYEEIVDRNQDPSFFYILPDNRYEIRIYPLFPGESRRIKLSFLVPSVWGRAEVTQDLLQNMFQATDFPLPTVSIAMPMDATWGTPTLQVGDTDYLMEETVVGGTGDVLHYVEIDGSDLVDAPSVKMAWEAPLNEAGDAFVSTYSDGTDQYYQVAYLPDWDAIAEDPSPDKTLLLIDYQGTKTTVTPADLSALLQELLLDNLSTVDAVNVAVNTTDGIAFMNPDDWVAASELDTDALEALLVAQSDSDLEELLTQGLSWAQTQADATDVYLLAANDDYTYPPIAEELFLELEPLIDPELTFALLDYQNINVSIIYYEDEVYYGNSHLYNLLTTAFADGEPVVLRDEPTTFESLISDLFPALSPPSGIVDYSVNLQGGVCYERFNLSASSFDTSNDGVLLQTGKYLGEFPMEIEGYLVTEDSEFYTLGQEVSETEVLEGDTLMREMWYAQHLQDLFGQVGSDEDREHIIDLSIQERILTPLTAFLALEPGLGGEPCVECLLNNGEVIIFSTEEFELEEANVSVSPNPTTTEARIRIDHPAEFQANDWQATIYDAAGRPVTLLPAPMQRELSTEWTWALDETTPAGIYFCKITSSYGAATASIVVVK